MIDRKLNDKIVIKIIFMNNPRSSVGRALAF